MGPTFESDEALLSRVRDDGDVEAFGCLYERHAPAARRFARSLCGNDADADDITAEVFTGLLASLRRGSGPSQLALPYLFASIRHRHWRTSGRRVQESVIASTHVAHTAECEGDVVEADVVRHALATLPDDVRMLLWRSEVADESVDEVVERDGRSAHSVAVTRHRARRALGTAYLAQHAEPEGGLTGLDPECQDTLAHLAALVRNRLGIRRRRRIERHLARCSSCAGTRTRLEQINTRLRVHPRLPWELVASGAGSTIKAHLSGWVGASVVTIAGSSALAVAVLAPAPTLVDEPPAVPSAVRDRLTMVQQDAPIAADLDEPTWFTTTTTAATRAITTSPAAPIVVPARAGPPPAPAPAVVAAAPATTTSPGAPPTSAPGQRARAVDDDDEGTTSTTHGDGPDGSNGQANGHGNGNGPDKASGEAHGLAQGSGNGGEPQGVVVGHDDDHDPPANPDVHGIGNGKALAKRHEKHAAPEALDDAPEPAADPAASASVVETP